MIHPLNLGIFIFNEVEVLDFAGPFEVFSLSKKDNMPLFKVVTIAEKNTPVIARNGLTILPNFTFNNHPALDILIIPGGYGAEEIEIRNTNTLRWIKQQYTTVRMLASVCTGALLLAQCGLLNGKRATTHWMDIDRLANDYPQVRTVKNEKFVDEGKILTSGGISSGINMSFHIVSKLFGEEVSSVTARRMEYDLPEKKE